MKHYNSQEEYLKAQANEAINTGAVVLKRGEKGDKGESGKDGKDGKDGRDGKQQELQDIKDLIAATKTALGI